MTMITPSYLGETIEYSSLHACRSTLEDPTRECLVDLPEGKRLLCWLSAGGKKGYYTLYPYAAMKPLFDQPLQNVYPVLHVKRS